MKKIINNEPRVLLFGYSIGGQFGNERIIPGVNSIDDRVFEALKEQTSFRRKLEKGTIEIEKAETCFEDLTQARAMKVVDSVHDPVELKTMMQKTNNTKVKGAIKEKLDAFEASE